MLGALTPMSSTWRWQPTPISPSGGAASSSWSRRGRASSAAPAAGARQVRHRHGPAGRVATRRRSPGSPAPSPPRRDVELAGLWTHFATADEPDDGFFAEQLDRFRELAEPLRDELGGPLLHAANSAATLREPASHFDMVRCGVAVYGLDPFGRDPAEQRLEPALELRSYVADVKRFEAGMSAGYGRTWRATEPTSVGVLPIGYGDGVRRGLTNNCDVLVDGHRYPLVGTVSMDNLTIDLGPEPRVRAGSRGGPDRGAGRRDDPRRGARPPAGDDQLRDHLRDLAAGAARAPRRPMTASRADRLLAAPAVAAAREALASDGEAWIVGGAIRDALAGRPVVDLDLAVAGDPARAARQISGAARGPAFELSAEYRTWRALDGERAWHVDVAALRGASIEDDLGERDFTVNAIAVPLADPTGPTTDPFGGERDLAAGLLRAVSGRSFGDDPLRILRAARLGSTLGLEPDPETLRLAREAAGRAGEPAGERQFAELRMLLCGPDPLRGLELLDELGATAAVLPELDGLRGVAQNPNHHLDVHGHTFRCWPGCSRSSATSTATRARAPGTVRALLAEPLADELTRGGALRFGAILHDAGKPGTRQEHEGGFVSFVGHDRAGAEVVREACARLKTSRTLSRHLAGLTLHHLHLGFMTRERPLPPRRLYDYLKLTEPVAADVTLLTVADRLSARGTGPTATPEMIEAHLELAREVLPAALAWHRDGPPRAPIAGDELAAAVGIEPGPELGRLLAEIEAAVFTGEVRTAGMRSSTLGGCAPNRLGA